MGEGEGGEEGGGEGGGGGRRIPWISTYLKNLSLRIGIKDRPSLKESGWRKDFFLVHL